MSEIKITRNAYPDEMKKQGVFRWPIWEKEESDFPWEYGNTETCYLLKGDVEVIPEGGEAVRFGAGDLVTFPRGMRCRWKIHKAVRKHYTFDQGPVSKQPDEFGRRCIPSGFVVLPRHTLGMPRHPALPAGHLDALGSIWLFLYGP